MPSTQTNNYKLEKPSVDDFYDVGVMNANMDKIDAALKALSSALSDMDLTTLSQAISAIDKKVTGHADESMPHIFTDNGVKYRWGFRTVNGEPQIIYEEVTV